MMFISTPAISTVALGREGKQNSQCVASPKHAPAVDAFPLRWRSLPSTPLPPDSCRGVAS
jgi:hypothetical protein